MFIVKEAKVTLSQLGTDQEGSWAFEDSTGQLRAYHNLFDVTTLTAAATGLVEPAEIFRVVEEVLATERVSESIRWFHPVLDFLDFHSVRS